MPAQRIPSGARPTFIGFMIREGWTREAATIEFDEHLNVGNNMARTRESYLARRRLGSPVLLTRSSRVFVYESFLNAINHASFESWVPEDSASAHISEY